MDLVVLSLETGKINRLKNIDRKAVNMPENENPQQEQEIPLSIIMDKKSLCGLTHSQVAGLFKNLKAQAETDPSGQKMQPINLSRHCWDSQYNPLLKIDNLEQETILREVNHGLAAGRLPNELYKEDNVEVMLRYLGLMDDLGLKNAAQVLFAKPGVHKPNECVMQLAAYSGKDKSVLLSSSRESGSLYRLLQAAMDFCHEHLPLLEGRFERIDENLALPMPVLREAVLNALCHRDYSDPSGSVCLNIYSDHLVIENNGSLPDNWSSFKLFDNHPSVPSNPLTCSVLHHTGTLSSLGRGFSWMVNQCSMHDLLPPSVDLHDGWIKLTLIYPDCVSVKTAHSPDMPPMTYKITQVVLKLGYGVVSAKQLRELLGLKSHDNFVRSYLTPALEAHMVEPEFPETPRHPRQRYRLTTLGRKFFEQSKQEQ